MGKIETLIICNRIYKNWVHVLYSLRRKKKIIEVSLRNGKTFRAPYETVYFINKVAKRNQYRIYAFFDINSGVLEFTYEGRQVKLKHYQNGILSGDYDVFLGIYDFLEPIKGNTVVDVGANIGDSTLYFAVKGASRILALEPYKYPYNMLVENVKLNNFDKNVITINAGYGEDGVIELEDNITSPSIELKECKGGVRTPILSLRTLLEQYSDILKGELLLKMDCEGSEYNLLKESKDTLQRFDRMVIEYHKGYEKLNKKLEECGFKCSYTKPIEQYEEIKKKNVVQGYLYAKFCGK